MRENAIFASGSFIFFFIFPYFHLLSNFRRFFEFPARMTEGITKFDSLTKIGEGTYGTVYRAVHKKTGLAVALKKISLSKLEGGIERMEVMIELQRFGGSAQHVHSRDHSTQGSRSQQYRQTLRCHLCRWGFLQNLSFPYFESCREGEL